MNATAPNRSALVGFAIGIVVVHFAINVARGIAHQHLAIGVNAFQKAFVAAVIVVAPFYAAYLIWKGSMRAGGVLLASARTRPCDAHQPADFTPYARHF
jgi:hypothetical protein